MTTDCKQPPVSAPRNDMPLRIVAGASSLGCYVLSRDLRKKLPLSPPFNNNFGKGFDYVEDIGFSLIVGEGCYNGLKYLMKKTQPASHSEQVTTERTAPLPIIKR